MKIAMKKRIDENDKKFDLKEKEKQKEKEESP
jgi:hypothetical protein